MLSVLLAAAAALAQEPAEPLPEHRDHFDLFLVARVPDTAGMGLVYEGPGRVRIGGSAGVLPGAFAGVVGDVGRDLELWDETTGYVVDRLLPGAGSVRATAGWRPARDGTFSFDLGYQFLKMSGDFDPTEVAETLGELHELEELSQYSEEEIAEGLEDLEIPGVRVRSNLHLVTLELGWQWQTPTNLLLRLGVGGLFAVGHTGQVEMDDILFQGEPIGSGEVRTTAETTLDDYIMGYFRAPTLGLSVGYRFL
jgi:hypothetical protein